MTQYKKYIFDISSGTALFVATLPLYIGIALVSGVSLYSSIISAVIGGTVVLFLSNSKKMVSGPAAGLSTFIFFTVTKFDSFNSFLLVIMVSGIIQIVFGALKIGQIINLIPISMTKGLLVAIGLVILVKEIPHLVGFQKDNSAINYGVLLTSLFLLLLYFLLTHFFKDFTKMGLIFPLCLFIGVLFSFFLDSSSTLFTIPQNLKINIDKESLTLFPIWNAKISNTDFYSVCFYGLMLALLATIESLLCITVMNELESNVSDKLNPNKELIFQGVGNILCGILGGLPLAAVIVRSSLNHYTQVKTKFAIFFHIILLILFVLFCKPILGLIPLCIPAFILTIVGYRLANPNVFVSLYNAKNLREFFLFLITVVSIILSNLTIGLLLSFLILLSGIIYDTVKLKEISFSKIVSVSKSIINYQRKSLIVFGSGFLTYLISKNSIFNYERNFINNLNVYAVVLSIAVFYFWEKRGKKD